MLKKTVLLLLIALLSSSCAPRIAMYSPAVYENAVTLKVETRVLVLQAGESYQKHRAEAKELMFKVEKAYEYARGLPDNELTAKQWEIMKDPEKNLLGGFIKMWQGKDSLEATLVTEKAGQIDKAYDQIIWLESKKINRSDLK